MKIKTGAATDGPEESDFKIPSFGQLCEKNYPLQWRSTTLAMWLLFAGFLGASMFNNYQKAREAADFLSNNTEVSAKVIDVIHILQNGDYEDYSIDLEYVVEGKTTVTSIDIEEESFNQTYAGATEIPLIYSNDDKSQANLRSYYEARSDMTSNWVSVLVGYVIVFMLLFFIRHYLLKVICSKTGK